MAKADDAKTDGGDIDEIIKAVTKCLDEWKKEITDIAKDLDKLGDEAKTGGGGKSGGGGGKEEKKDTKAGDNKSSQKIQTQAEKDAEAAGKKLSEDLKKMLSTQKPPSDPKQVTKLTDFMDKYIDKNGVKLKDWGSVKPDIDIDVKKMTLKKLGVTWTWKW